MKYTLHPLEADGVVTKWRDHPFYTSSIVAGLDIGLQGIGICVRRGQTILYAKTWYYDVPEAARLESRRQKRSSRHCRANRLTRMRRLKALFDRHDLPWLEETSEAVLHSDPYKIRHRAVTRLLGSKQALSLAIRHCVAHRGYDYDYFSDEGAYPWGDSTEYKKVLKELEKIWLTEEAARKAMEEARTFEWKEAEYEEFARLARERTAGLEKIGERLAAHVRGEQNHKRPRARGEAFARKLVWQHLETIIQRHAHLIKDADGFLSALAVNPKHGGSKEEAIFYYHRKTPDEMRRHFEKKKAPCRYADWLGLPAATVDKNDSLAVRRFHLVEFLATRDVQLTDGSRIPVGEEQARALMDWMEAHPSAKTAREAKPHIDQLRKNIEKEHGAKVAPESGKNKSDLNVWFFSTLRDLLAPNAANRGRNAPMCAPAAEKLFAMATRNGWHREEVKASLKELYDFRQQGNPDLHGLYPQVEFLLGQRVKKTRTRHGKRRGDRAHGGILQKVFAELAGELGGAMVPEYCIVETARDLPRTQKQKSEHEAENAANRKRREELFKRFGLEDSAKGSARRRVELHDQQRGVCPFTGDSLGDNPLSENLDFEHLFPRKSGGLTINDNLVLTFKTINAKKGKRTPREFAASGESERSFDEMCAYVQKMRWGKSKRDIFAWEQPGEIPPFGNTTRVSQLARQLYAELADWMEAAGHERARRLGTPSGFQTAACRRAWGLPLKDRSDLTHHLVDAVALSYIPPREGQNYVASGGIFLPAWDEARQREILDVLPLGPEPERVLALAAPDAVPCPLARHRSSSAARSIHDETQWGVREDGALAIREKLPPKSELDPIGLRQRLIDSGIPTTYRRKDGTEGALIPSDKALERWLNSPGDAPLKLLNGTPVKALKKTSKKGSFKTDPLGFHARRTPAGKYAGVKSINGRWDRLELWRGWDQKKKRWAYFKQLVPSKEVLAGLRALGLSWAKKPRKPWRHGGETERISLKEQLTEALPPHACPAVHPETGLPAIFRLDAAFLAATTPAGRLAKRGQTAAGREWIYVTAVKAESGGRISFKKQLAKDAWEAAPTSADDLAFLAGLPPADDPSSYPRQRAPGDSRPGRAANLRLE